MPRMHNEKTDLHKPLCFAINRSWLFKWFTRSSSDMYGDTLGNTSCGLFSVKRNGEFQGINLKLCCDLQYNILTGATQSFVSGLLQVGEAQFQTLNFSCTEVNTYLAGAPSNGFPTKHIGNTF